MSPPQAKAASAGEAFAVREFDYTARDFERVRRLIRDRVGIALNESKQNMVYNRLVKRLRALQLASFADYLAPLDDAEHPEWQHFVNALTTNLSHFFREEYHFPMLVAHVQTLGRSPVRIWSAAASTGEEPYSIAITLCEAYDSLQPPASIFRWRSSRTWWRERRAGSRKRFSRKAKYRSATVVGVTAFRRWARWKGCGCCRISISSRTRAASN